MCSVTFHNTVALNLLRKGVISDVNKASRTFRRFKSFCLNKRGNFNIRKNELDTYKTGFFNSHLFSVHSSFTSRGSLKQCNFPEDKRLQKFLNSVVKEYVETEEKLSDSNKTDKSLMQTLLRLKPLVSLKSELDQREMELEELNKIIAETQDDRDFLKIAAEEKKSCMMKIENLKEAILGVLLPEEAYDDRDVIVELSAGVGGQEAMLFAKDLFDMYCRYAAFRGWTSEILKFDATDLGGLHSADIAISGMHAYKTLKFEAGVHRVQRVPKTERTGRIHTSTVTVAVLPQPTEIDINLHPNDVDVECKRSSGPGGQNVNKRETCVRLTHIPTGVWVECQSERFQYTNKERAFKALRAKLYQRELDKLIEDENHSRKLMVGSAARSEKIRTYNFPQDRITDHRIQQNTYDVDLFLLGTEKLDKMLEHLQNWSDLMTVDDILRKYGC